MAIRLGVEATLFEDAINLVLCRAGCNGFDNRFHHEAPSQPDWPLEAFLEIHDRIFAARRKRIETRRAHEATLFASRPWETGGPAPLAGVDDGGNQAPLVAGAAAPASSPSARGISPG